MCFALKNRFNFSQHIYLLAVKLACFLALHGLPVSANAQNQREFQNQSQTQSPTQWNRSLQLLGNPAYANRSFTVNPLDALASLDSVKSAKAKLKLSFLPITVIQQYNTHHPYGFNDGAMIAAKGFQSFIRLGLHANWKIFEMQLAPEAVWAANPTYASNPAYGSNAGGAYAKLFPGQSFAQINLSNISLGLSSQNRWWGPGIRSALLMSNNAPGFLHGFIGSKQPIKTPIGHLEFQLIGAKLSSDLSRPFENAHLKPKAGILANNRYQNALVLSYQPRWVPGLYLGFTRSIQRYYKDLALSGSFLNQYIPILFKPLAKSNAQADDTMQTDQQASLFLRWVFPKSNAEFYAEWGFNDYGQNLRDYLMAPTHSAAYTLGFKKMIILQKEQYLDLGLEITQMSESPDRIIRSAGNWYEHGQIGQGYTHFNQIMGAGAGFGANIQSLVLQWVNTKKETMLQSLGFRLERIEHDPNNFTTHWTDLGLGFLPSFQINRLRLGAVLQLNYSQHYGWQSGNNPINLHSQLKLQWQL